MSDVVAERHGAVLVCRLRYSGTTSAVGDCGCGESGPADKHRTVAVRPRRRSWRILSGSEVRQLCRR